MFELNERNPSLLVDLKNYKAFVRRLWWRDVIRELRADALLCVGVIVAFCLLALILPLTVPLG